MVKRDIISSFRLEVEIQSLKSLKKIDMMNQRLSLETNPNPIIEDTAVHPIIRGNLGSKMGLIRKRAKISFCELEFKNP